MQIPVLSGIYTDEAPDFRTSYPRNMMPVPKQQGISNGYLRPAEGINTITSGPGVNRGAINWNGAHYRVLGTKLVRISESGTVTELGDIPGSDLVTFDYSFDYLGISANSSLYLFDGFAIQQVTDADLGTVVDHIWVDGYFMTTDGEFLVVTELNNPFSVLPTKYGSSEADPDPVVALVKLRNEPHALNRYTIEVFDNVGGSGFPFQRIDGAQIQRGVIGTHACCVFLESVAFVGGGRNEPVAVWLAASGSSAKISSREIDQLLAGYSDDVLAQVLIEARVDKGHQFLLIHLPDQTIVYDAAASQVLGQQVWFTLSSGVGQEIYRARHLVWCHNKWWVGDTNSGQVGQLTEVTSEHWGNLVGWEFGTMIAYNEGRGAIFHELELVCLTGRQAFGADPRVATQYSVDGETWSMPKYIRAGTTGQRNKRLVWLNQGNMRHWRIQRFNGTSDAHLTVARLEARIEPLGI
jgi:hypothetical protein